MKVGDYVELTYKKRGWYGILIKYSEGDINNIHPGFYDIYVTGRRKGGRRYRWNRQPPFISHGYAPNCFKLLVSCDV